MSWGLIGSAAIGTVGGVLASKNSGSSQTTATSAPPSWAIPYMDQIGSEAQGLYNQGPQQFYPGQTFADFNPLQQRGFYEQQRFAEQGLPQLNNQIFGGFGQALNTDVTQDPSVQAALGSIENRAGRLFNNQILPGIESQAIGAGGLGGSRQGVAQGLAAQGLQQGVADAQGAFLGDQLSSARAAQSAALGMSPQIAQQGLLGGNILGNIGGAYQGQNQLGINEAMRRFNFGQQAPTNALSDYANLISGLTGNFGVQTQTGSSGTNPWAGALGGAMLGGQVYNQFSPMFSNLFGGSTFGTTSIPANATSQGDIYRMINP